MSLHVTAGRSGDATATDALEAGGHRVQVFLRVYAKCVAGQDEAARRHTEGALDMRDDQGEG